MVDVRDGRIVMDNDMRLFTKVMIERLLTLIA